MLNISVHTLRMYEREGLIIPFKKESNHRLYSQSDLDRIECIRRAISEKKISINGIKTIYSLIPCWDLLGCTKRDRINCKAFTAHSEPCWVMNEKGKYCQDRDCRVCTVYNDYSECDKVKEAIKNISGNRS
ncbi:MAG: hypothetical protein Kow0098_09590 [Ignavibacteriaceae bacterium]